MVPHPSNPLSTSPADWAKAFLDAHPELDIPPFEIGLWFLHALEAGWHAGDYGQPLECYTTPPEE